MSERTPEEFIESVSQFDDHNEHEDNCGICFHKYAMAQAARNILESGNFENALERWDIEAKRIWQEGKYFKLWQAEKAAGRDPQKAFEERGWEA